jgi:hypothetical protein
MAEDPRPVLVVFLGGMGGSPVEDMLATALQAAALDSLEEALGTGAFAGAILATDAAERLPVHPARLSGRQAGGPAGPEDHLPPGVTVDPDRGPFHFGRRLAGIIEQHRLESIVYFGAGSVPLFRGSDFTAIASGLSATSRIVISNNFYSGDLIAFRPASALLEAEPPAVDNALPRLLRDQADLESQPLPRSTATQFNIDSPADLAALALHSGASGGGPRLSCLLRSLDLDLAPYRRCLPLLTNPSAEVLVAGRVGSQVWQYLERETACRVRVFSEERGMAAAARERVGARSLLGYHLQAVGLVRFFEELATLGDAAFIDTRILLAHLGLHPSRADRFLSDLGRAMEIEDAFLREFTEAAAEAAIPVLLGGHSLVSGGLMALIETAWREYDRRLG